MPGIPPPWYDRADDRVYSPTESALRCMEEIILPDSLLSSVSDSALERMIKKFKGEEPFAESVEWYTKFLIFTSIQYGGVSLQCIVCMLMHDLARDDGSVDMKAVYERISSKAL